MIDGEKPPVLLLELRLPPFNVDAIGGRTHPEEGRLEIAAFVEDG